jgi:hypothetical protein
MVSPLVSNDLYDNLADNRRGLSHISSIHRLITLRMSRGIHCYLDVSVTPIRTQATTAPADSG